MIQHAPRGLGNPYRIEPDQRFPVLVEVGSKFELRIVTDAAITECRVEHRVGGELQSLSMTNAGPAVPTDYLEWSKPAPAAPKTESHLAEAAARAGEQTGKLMWTATLAAPADATVPCTYRFISESADSLETSDWSEVPLVEWRPAPSAVRLREVGSSPAVEVSGVEVLVDQAGNRHAVRFALPVKSSSAIAGLGERYHDINHRGRRIDARVYEHYKAQGERAYFPLPFAHVVGESWSFWVNTTTPSRYDFCATDAEHIKIEVELEQPHRDVELVFFGGEPSTCLAEFLKETGRPTLPPEWAFGLWLSSNEWNTQARVERELEQARVHGIHPDVVVIEAWSDESTFIIWRDAEYRPKDPGKPFTAADFSYPPDGAWSDPKAMVDRLHADGTRLVLWQIPVLKERGSEGSQSQLDWDYAIANNMVVTTGSGEPYRNRGFWFAEGMLPDFTDRAVREWWTERRAYLVEEFGIDGFKTDGGEHAWGEDLRYADGTTGVSSNGRLATLYPQAYHEMMRRHGKQPLTFSRSGFTGATAFPCHWAGDEDSTWDAFKASIRAGINAGASGIFFWGWDLAGFSGPIPDAELYIRSTEMAILCPILQVHSEFNHHREPQVDRTPWNIAERTGDDSVIPAFKKLLAVRNRLLPYIQEQALLAVSELRPIMRGIYFDYPHDAECWKYPLQYMFGSAILVAPITDPGVSQADVYLPEGDWLNAWSGERAAGSQVLQVSAPLGKIPVFIRADRSDLLDAFRVP